MPRAIDVERQLIEVIYILGAEVLGVIYQILSNTISELAIYCWGCALHIPTT